MDTPTGFVASAFAGDDTSDVLEREPEDGYLGRLQERRVLIQARVNFPEFIGIDVDHKDNVRAKKNWAEHTEPHSVYRRKVPCQSSAEGWHYAPYPGNKISLLEIGERGHLTLWEVALISQRGEFFLTTQKAREVRWFRADSGVLACPTWKDWPQMHAFIEPLLLDAELPSILEYMRENEAVPNAADLEPNTGRVIWYNLANGLGAILAPTGEEARVHWTQIAPRGRLAYLAKGERVSFKELRKPIQTGLYTTTFLWEAVGVKAL